MRLRSRGPTASPGNLRGDVGRHVDEHLGALRRDEIADHRREARGAVVFARESDRDADGEQQAEVREDRVAGGGDGGESSRSGCPSRSSSAATGNTAIGSISARPMLLQRGEKILHEASPGTFNSARTAAASSSASARRARSRQCVERQRGYDGLEARDHRRHHRELGDPEPDQHRHRRRIGGEPAAHRDRFAVHAPPLRRPRR